ncbi:MAG: hypothetical protein IH586_12790, partial [Anaerolineaceae bacterium]|nr:hypothetical protein [Anaerolineaceae bacterium]
MIALAEKLDVDGVNFFNFLPSPFPGFTAEERSLFVEDTEIFDTLRQFKQKNKSPLTITYPTLLTKNGKSTPNCDYFFRQIRINPDGNYGSCSVMVLDLNRNGDVFEGVKSFNGAYFQSMRQRILDHQVESINSACRYCPENSGVQL